MSTERRGVPGPHEPLALGVATAAYQVEGATAEDGRGPSTWDVFCRVPGAVRDGSDGSVACDSYHRLEEDLDLVAGLGVDWYRFSVAWPRVLPAGTGAVEQRGLAYYDRLVDGLLERGVAPLPTLYHWDLPQALEEAGGWTTRATAEAFAEYAAHVHARLGDRVGAWATLNEPWCSAYLGHAAGVHAPGRRMGERASVAAHHLMLGHGLAARALTEAGAGDVGVVLNLAPVRPEHPDDEGCLAAARHVDALRNRLWLDPLVDGAYGEDVRRAAPSLEDPAVVRDGDLALLHGSAAWVGVNYYTPVRVGRPDPSGQPDPQAGHYPGLPGLRLPVPGPRTDIGWEVDATGLEEVLLATSRRTGLPVLVTENGAAYHDVVAEDGSVADPARVAYLADHLAATERAREAGADVRAYLAWTLLDNFEWAEGYTQSFGLVEVDPLDQRRTPKSSYHWFASRAGEQRRLTP